MTTVTGYNFLTGVNTTYSGVFFITLKEWGHRKAPDEKYIAILKHVNSELSKIPGGRAFAFSPPAIPGIGTSGGVTFILQDRSGKDVAFLAENVEKLRRRSAGAQGTRRRHADVFTRRAASFPERGPRQGA